MTPKEAIEQLESLIINSQYFHDEEGDIWEKDIEALNMAIEALEKQIPKKPIDKTKSTDDYGYCPNCKTIIDDYSDFKFCSTCGQAIDWSEEE